ncbi:MAG: glycosyltransferase family 39 protein [Roseiflexus sp.]
MTQLVRSFSIQSLSAAQRRIVVEGALALAACAVAAPAMIYLVIAYLNLDLWYDELYSLDFFVFVPFQTIVTDYHAPNNHIFANLLNHIYIYSLGLDDIALLESPWKIRVLMLTYTIVACVYVYLIGKNIFGSTSSIAIVGILGTTLPFLNYAVQVRGYGLSIMLLCVILYHSMRFYETHAWKHGIMVVVSVALILYTIPSNVYFVFSMMLHWFISIIVSFTKTKSKKISYALHYPGTILIGLSAMGCAIATLCYMPVLSDVMNNEYVQTSSFLNIQTLLTLMPRVFKHFLSGRWILLILALFGVTLLVHDIRRSRDARLLANKLLLMLTLLIAPFVLSSVRGDFPYDRTFIPLVIPFSVFFGVMLARTFRSMSGYVLIFAVMVAIISSWLALAETIAERDRILQSNLNTGNFSQNNLANFYQQYFMPSKLAKEFMAQYDEESIIVIGSWLDEFAVSHYVSYWAERYGKTVNELHFSSYLREQWLDSRKIIYYYTNKPDAQRFLEEQYPMLNCAYITSPGQLGMVLRCDHRDRPARPAPVWTESARPRVSLGKGWYSVERTESETFRWGGANNRIWLVNPYDRPIHVTLALMLESYETVRPAELWDGRRLLARWDVQPARRTYRFGMTIAPGHTHLQLRAPTADDPNSPRKLSVKALQWRIADYVPVKRR